MILAIHLHYVLTGAVYYLFLLPEEQTKENTMIITNKLGLPEAFVQMAQQNEKMADNEIRVTSLLNGLCEEELKRRYYGEIVQDVSDMIWMLFGTAAHAVLENQDESDTQFKEERLKMKVSNSILTGKSDLYDAKTKTITDYKTTSVWKIIYQDYEAWEKQLMIYAALWINAGFPVEKCEIIAILKDHSKTKAKLDPNYPQLPVQKITFTVTKERLAKTKEYIETRVAEREALRDLKDEELPICTLAERYNDGDKYAVMLNNRKKALRVLDDYAEAKDWMKENGGDYINVRKGENKKCKEYCAVKDFCPHMKGRI